MFIKDIRKEFYYNVCDQRTLVLVAHDVDALCAWKILESLFCCDHTIFTVVSVAGQRELERAWLSHSDQVQSVILINCGATVDIVDLLQPEEHVVIYIVDSHRPIDVFNIFNDQQVILLMPETEEEGIPKFKDVFWEGHESDDEDDEEEGRVSDEDRERRILRRRERRLWDQKRQQILFDYSQFSFYGTASSVIVYDLALKMSRENNDILWWGILGLADQHVCGRLEPEKYTTDSVKLQAHVARLNHRTLAEEKIVSVNCMKISFTTDLALDLYRHWSLFDSIQHTRYTSCHFRLWTVKGMKKLHEFLADIGLPLVQAKQTYNCMSLDVRNNLKQLIEQHAEKYQFNRITYGTFLAQYGYKQKYSASDVILATYSYLENTDTSATLSGNFLAALDCLDRKNTELLEDGVRLARVQRAAIKATVHSVMDMNQVLSAGPFLFATVSEGQAECRHFSRPHCLQWLARFLRDAKVATARNKKAAKLPLLVSAPYDCEQGTCLVAGVPPHDDDSAKNFFGKAFEQASSKTSARVLADFFDSSVIILKVEDRSKFFDALISILQ